MSEKILYDGIATWAKYKFYARMGHLTITDSHFCFITDPLIGGLFSREVINCKIQDLKFKKGNQSKLNKSIYFVQVYDVNDKIYKFPFHEKLLEGLKDVIKLT